MKTPQDLVAAAKAHVQEVPLAEAEAAIREADALIDVRDVKVVLYCKTSGRAALAAASMREMGYLNVKSIAGGFDAWQAAGKPVAKPELPSFG